jgi:hypothetical protein
VATLLQELDPGPVHNLVTPMTPAAPPLPDTQPDQFNWTPAQRQELFVAVCDAFDTNTLTIALSLGAQWRLDRWVSVNAGFEQVVFNVLDEVERGGWYEVFVRAVYVYRPRHRLILAFCRDHAPYVFTPTPQQQAVNAAVRISELFGRGAVPDGVRVGVRAAAAASADTLGRIDQMGRYKQLHDLLHALDYGLVYELSRSVGMLRGDPQRFRATPAEVRQFRKYCDQLDEQAAVIGRIIGLLPDARRAVETIWSEHLLMAARMVREAIGATGNTADADTGLELLRDTLAQQPVRINAQVVELARGVNLPDLADRFRAAAAQLPQNDLLAAPLGDALVDLAGLGPRVADLVAEHDAWQRLDNPLGMVARTPSYLRIMWPQIVELATALAEAHAGREWATELAAAIGRYGAAADQTGREFAFDDLRQVAGRRFRAVDAELLELATALRHVAAEVQTVAGVFVDVHD